MGSNEQLAKLATPFPGAFIEKTPGRNSASYVAHHIVNQWLLGIVGPFDFELVGILRGDVAAIPPNPRGSSDRAKQGRPALSGVVVGGVWRLRCNIDRQWTHVEEVGDCEDPHNWPHDGARLKDAASDALKRCAMRIGLGLHLWAQEHYVLADRLALPDEDDQTSPEPGSTSVQGAATRGRTGRAANGARDSSPDAAPHPAGEGDTTPAGAVELEGRPAPAPADPPDEPLPDLGADATAAERAFHDAGMSIKQASELLVERWPQMAAQYTPRNLRKLRGQQVIREHVDQAVKLRAERAKRAAEQARAQDDAAESGAA